MGCLPSELESVLRGPVMPVVGEEAALSDNHGPVQVLELVVRGRRSDQGSGERGELEPPEEGSGSERGRTTRLLP